VRWIATLGAVALLVGSCDESMDGQNRFRTYGPADNARDWPAPGEALPQVAGTVAQGDLERGRQIAEPPDVSPALLRRGQERYDIDCSVCHGLTGAGDGIVVARGFPRPRAFDDPRLLKAPARELVDAIGQGYGLMYSFADRVEPRDRWAVVAYIRALQLADRKAAP
jgi:mono/diheme cytochrome c family protein